MSSEITATIIIAAIASAPGLASLVLQRRKSRSETDKIDAEVAAQYQKIASDAALRTQQLEERITALEEKSRKDAQLIAELRARVQELEQENRRLKASKGSSW